jgi:hypothetical protein
MTTKSTLRIGLLAMVVASGVVTAADSFALDAIRADVIATLNKKVAQLDGNKVRDQQTRVDVIGSIGPNGPAYPYTKPMNR